MALTRFRGSEKCIAVFEVSRQSRAIFKHFDQVRAGSLPILHQFAQLGAQF
jgi:hypothetical protein